MRINWFVIIFVIAASAITNSCGSKTEFPTEVRYWSPEEYRDVIWKIRGIPENEGRPRFSDPETIEIIKKITDPSNYEVVLNDTQLGLNHKATVSQAFFEQYRNLVDLYRGMDKQDNYVYPQELIAIETWGLGLQLLYFKLGNERIRQQSDNPDDEGSIRVIRSNEETILKNFNNYLDNINDEKSFTTFAPQLADGINDYFIKLPDFFPEADFSITINKAESMLQKSQTTQVKSALKKLIDKLKSSNRSQPE